MTDNLPDRLRRAAAFHARYGRVEDAPLLREAADTIEALTVKVEDQPAPVTIEDMLESPTLPDLVRRILEGDSRVAFSVDDPSPAEPSLTMLYSAVMELRAEVREMAAAVERKSTPIFHITHAEAQAAAPDGVKLWSPEDEPRPWRDPADPECAPLCGQRATGHPNAPLCTRKAGHAGAHHPYGRDPV